jgi:hypothetical protein
MLTYQSEKSNRLALQRQSIPQAKFATSTKQVEQLPPSAQAVQRKPDQPNTPSNESSILGSPDYLNDLITSWTKLFNDEMKTMSPLDDNGYVKARIAASNQLIKTMKTDVERYKAEHGSTDNIKNEYWIAFCEKFNEHMDARGGVLAASGTDAENKDLHYFRNELNRAPSDSLDGMIAYNKNLKPEEKWELLSKDTSIYHMFGEGGDFNLKFVSPDGLFEAVYNKEGKLLTDNKADKAESSARKYDPINMGTYNYSSPKEFIGHGIKDVLPYDDIILFGKGWANVEGTTLPTSDPFANANRYSDPTNLYNGQTPEQHHNEYELLLENSYANMGEANAESHILGSPIYMINLSKDIEAIRAQKPWIGKVTPQQPGYMAATQDPYYLPSIKYMAKIAIDRMKTDVKNYKTTYGSIDTIKPEYWKTFENKFREYAIESGQRNMSIDD